jgi:hypothetical protein
LITAQSEEMKSGAWPISTMVEMMEQVLFLETINLLAEMTV